MIIIAIYSVLGAALQMPLSGGIIFEDSKSRFDQFTGFMRYNATQLDNGTLHIDTEIHIFDDTDLDDNLGIC